jgi:hypothetical protein
VARQNRSEFPNKPPNEAGSEGGGESGRRPLFRPMILALTLVILGVYMAIQAGTAGTRFMPALNDPGPALSRVAPQAGHTPPRLARRVGLVIIDGLRLRESYGLPFLDRLRRQGVDSSATSHYPTFSRPNYITLVTGVPPAASGVRTNEYDTEVLLDSLMDRAGAAGMRSALVADYSVGLPRMFTRIDASARGVHRYQSAFHDASFAGWPGGLVSTAGRLVEDGYPFMIILPGAVDDAGHEHGGDSREYRDAVRQADAMLQSALERFDLDRDALIIVADHGHTDPGGHGGIEPEVMEVPLILVGAGVRAGAAVAGARLVDIAPTAAALLGLPAPGHGLGRTLTEALILDPTSIAAIARADRERVLRNQMIVAAWQARGDRQAARERLRRVPLMIGLMVCSVAFIITARRLGALHIDWRVLVIALPAFPLTYYALVAVFGQQFSPSFIPERGSVVDLLFRFGLLSMVAHIVISWFAVHGRLVLTERLATANGLFACGLLISVVPLALAWSLVPGPFASVPGPTLMLLVPATYVACACYAISVASTLALELVVFFARAVDPRMERRRQGSPGRLPRSGAM